MDLISGLEKLKDKAVIGSLVAVSILLSPGILILFCFHRDLFLAIDWIKLLVLALSLGVPFVVVNIAAFSIENEGPLDFFTTFITAIWIYCLFAFVILAIRYFSFPSMTEKSFFALIGILESFLPARRMIKKAQRIAKQRNLNKA